MTESWHCAEDVGLRAARRLVQPLCIPVLRQQVLDFASRVSEQSDTAADAGSLIAACKTAVSHLPTHLPPAPSALDGKAVAALRALRSELYRLLSSTADAEDDEEHETDDVEDQAQLIDALLACALDVSDLAKVDRDRISAAGLGVVTFLAEAALRKAAIKSSNEPLRAAATLKVDGVGAPPKVLPAPSTSVGAALPMGDHVEKRLLKIESNREAFDDGCLQLAHSLLTMAIIHHAVHYHVAESALTVHDLRLDSRKQEPCSVKYVFSGAVAFRGRRRAGKEVRHWQLELPWPASLPAGSAARTLPAAITASVAAADETVADADAAFAPFWRWQPACSVSLRLETL